MSSVLNYQAETRRCSECKYHRWYRAGKRYGCSSDRHREICGSFRPHDNEKEERK